jgi:hypothetical protein
MKKVERALTRDEQNLLTEMTGNLVHMLAEAFDVSIQVVEREMLGEIDCSLDSSKPRLRPPSTSGSSARASTRTCGRHCRRR